jgi:beta-glucosidase
MTCFCRIQKGRAPLAPRRRTLAFALVGLALLFSGRAVTFAGDDRPWSDASLSASQRAELVVEQMTQEEKLALVHGGLGAPWGSDPKPQGAIGSAGYVPGIARLGIPPLQETDAELGIANPGFIRRGDTATAMPSDLALAATWDPSLARRQGEAVGAEARAKGFSVLLGGAANLIRDPRGGRNFEYFSEDPLLTGMMAGNAIAGVQSRRVIATLKHFALNDQETDRVELDARIDRSAARESDLLAFEFALEQGHPGSVMCAYNQVNGDYSCENSWLLNDVLKGDWRYPGFVMSDWGAVHSTLRSVLSGLDLESGEQLDTENFLDAPLAKAVAHGAAPKRRIDDMAARILTSIFASGVYDDPPIPSPINTESSDRTALEIAREGVVLLKNDNLLPIAGDARRLAVIGAHSDQGVPSGGGSSQVIPRGGIAAVQPSTLIEGEMVFDPSPPLDAIRRQLPRAAVDYDDGRDVARAAALAAKADIAIVFADQWMAETTDAPNMQLPDEQDQLIEAVTRANPHSVIVLETGGAVLMPWLAQASAVVEAWYPGQQGGQAIAEILSGAVNPTGRLPVTFPANEAQLPRVKVAGDPAGAPRGPVGRGGHYGAIFTVAYDEGANVGYKWFEARRERPLFPFGFGLSYTMFRLSDLTADAVGDVVHVSVKVRNAGDRPGAAVAQFYVSGPDGARLPLRLAGWSRPMLAPGEEQRVSATIDRRLLGRFDESARRWRITAGVYQISAGFDVAHRELTASIELGALSAPP